MKTALKWTAMPALLFFLSVGCDQDNPVAPHNHEHAEAVGLVLFQDSQEIVRYQDGNMSGEVNLTVGEKTPWLAVSFIDEHDGHLFVPEGDHYSMAWSVADESVAEIEQSADNIWLFRILGQKQGQTEFEIKIMHEQHADFVSLPIPIQVEP
ncbi:MAG: hypothetical protein U5R06_00610 [candidate division KSB1 bacterium]|nr:hypothetical protein [candidate division KSB1 bacterium]